jgi:hypothetical protein
MAFGVCRPAAKFHRQEPTCVKGQMGRAEFHDGGRHEEAGSDLLSVLKMTDNDRS